MVELTPKCLSGKGYGYSAQGYLLPCCWCDPRENRTVNGKVDLETEEIKSIFWKEHLKLTNVDSINEILRSKEWRNFYDTLVDDPNNALEVCKRYCKTTQSTKLKEKFSAKMAKAENDHSTGIKIRYGEQDE